MKRYFTVLAALAVLLGCSKSQDTTTAQSSATGAAAAASSAAEAATSAANAASTAANAAATAQAAAASAAAAAATAGAGGSTGAIPPIDIPVYPGATKETDKSLSMSGNGSSVKVDYYLTKDTSQAVIDWYKAHLPSNWTNFTIANGSKSVGTFSSPEHGNEGQSVIITGGDSAGTHIQLSTKTGS